MTDLFEGLSLALPEEPVALGIAEGAAVAVESESAALEIPFAAELTEAPSIAEILPRDFKLPDLIKFVPNGTLRAAVDAASEQALAVAVTGRAGVAQADAALGVLRAAIKRVEGHFADPKALAHQLHKSISSVETEWLKIPGVVVSTVGKRILDETARLDAAAREEQRQRQAAADAEAKRIADEAAKAAEAAQAPAAVVETLKVQAKVATAAPVAMSSTAPLAHSAPAGAWKMRLAGTPEDGEINPAMKDLTTDAQRVAVQQVCKAIIDGRLPINTIKELDWAYLNKRAAAESTTWKIAGLEPVFVKSLRAKPNGRR